MLCYVDSLMLYCDMLCYNLLRHVMLCYVMICYVMFCYVMLRHSRHKCALIIRRSSVMIYHVNIILMIIPVNRHVKDHGDCGRQRSACGEHYHTHNLLQH